MRPHTVLLRPVSGSGNQAQTAEVQFCNFPWDTFPHPDRAAAPAPPVAAGDEPVQRGIRYWAAPLRQQFLNAGHLQPVAGQPLVDLVGPRSQFVLAVGTADCRGPERPIAARRLSCSSVGAGPSRDISNASLSCATLCVPVNEIVKDFTFADPVRTYVIVLS